MGLAQDLLVVGGLVAVGIAGLFFLARGIGQSLEGFELPSLPSLPDITLPTINFPTFEFPTFEFPSLPDITFPTFEFPEIDFPEIPGLPTFEFPTFEFPSIPDIFGGGLAETPEEASPIELPVDQPGGGGVGIGIGDELDVEFTPAPTGDGIVITDPTGGIGGGPSFEGGVTTFGNLDEIVDTLSEVLQIFPGLSASQARDALEESPGLTFGEFAVINPDVINISDGGA